MSINRPEVTFNAGSHTYTLGGEEMLGVSTVAKVGQDNAWEVASAWGYRIGYEGAHDVLTPHPSSRELSKDQLREKMIRLGLSPWSKRDKAAERGTWVHDTLEALAQTGQAPTLTDFPEEVRGYVRGVLRWFLDYRPEFVATEVQVASEQHGYAGRYDIRCELKRSMGECLDEHETVPDAWVGPPAMVLVDLKTSKGVYPTTHFPQLAGYELASVEMGFGPTDAQFVLCVHDDGTYEFKRSWAGPEHFLAYLAAARAIRDIKSKDPQEIRKREVEAQVVAALETPQKSAELAATFPDWGLDARGVGFVLSRLKKRGLVVQGARGYWEQA